jgi:hypothetical protein
VVIIRQKPLARSEGSSASVMSEAPTEERDPSYLVKVQQKANTVSPANGPARVASVVMGGVLAVAALVAAAY